MMRSTRFEILTDTKDIFYFYFKNYIISRLKKRDLLVKAYIFKITGGLKGN